jgi:hypothetical protein
MANLQVNTLPADDLAADPAMAAARSFMQQHGPVRSSEEVVYLRFLIHREVYQDVSPAINVAADFSVTYWLTRPALAWNFIAMANADFFRPHFDGINIRRAPDADFEVDGRRYGVFAHDWRVEPPTAWLAWRRSMFWLPKDDESRDLARAPVFTPDTFAAAVLDALRNYTRPMLLAANPLNRTWLVERAPRETSDVSNLQRLLHDAVASLNANPKERKLHRALWYTYIEPLATQERAAEHLSIPFSTYRYQLTKGVERVAEGLWRRYTGDRPRRST